MILCVGTTPTVQRTLVFDRLKVDDVNRAIEVHEYASGKAVNVARVLTVLGAGALAVGFQGGRRGEVLLEDLNRTAVLHDFVTTNAQTRLCTTVVDRAGGTATELVEESPAASQSEWDQLIVRIDAHIGTAKVAVFAGTLAPGAPSDFLARWIGRAPLTVIDAKGNPLRTALQAANRGRLIAKLNRDEFAATVGADLSDDADLHAAMRREAPPDGWLIVTLGKAGALALADGRLFRATPPGVQTVSAVGSGDSFTAGLVAAFHRGPEYALRLASACGAANALTPHSGHLNRADVVRLMEEARVEEVAG
jgi:1-phosphofructokinase family hexose kinase